MKFRLLVISLALSVTLPVMAQITTIQLAHEVPLGDVRLPQYDSGTLAFKPCSECDYQTTRVSPDCTWRVNGRSMTLQKFREFIAGLEDSDSEYLTVMHHLKNDRITRVSILVQ